MTTPPRRGNAGVPEGPGIERTNVGVWGVHNWDSPNVVWGRNDGERIAAEPSPTNSTGTWGVHCWVTDPFVRWP